MVKASEETVINLATDSSVRLNLSLDFLYEPYLINPSFLFPCSPHSLAFQILLFFNQKTQTQPKMGAKNLEQTQKMEKIREKYFFKNER